MKVFNTFKNFIREYPFICLVMLSVLSFFIYEVSFSSSIFRKNLELEAKKLHEWGNSAISVFADFGNSKEKEEKEPEVESAVEASPYVNAAGEDILEKKEEEQELDAVLIPEEELSKEEKKTWVSTKLDFKEAEGVFTTVDESYFDDALFIGDSRTESLQLYSGWKNASYYASQGISIWKILVEPIVPVGNDKKVTVEEALREKNFKKIYIMLGVNELGVGTDDEFLEQYKVVLKRVQELQPEAVIFIQSIFHVTREKSDSEKYINNFIINARNLKLATLADNKKVFFIDSNKVLDDETGALDEKYTFDGVHLYAKELGVFKDFILNHGILIEEKQEENKIPESLQATPEELNDIEPANESPMQEVIEE